MNETYAHDKPFIGKYPVDFKKSQIKRIIPLKEVEKNYEDEAKLAVIFNHEVVEMDDGVWRWKGNQLVEWLQDYTPAHTPPFRVIQQSAGSPYCGHGTPTRCDIDLNTLWGDFYNGMFTVEEFMKFYMQIGYSLCGFREVFAQTEASEWGLPGAKTPKSREHYTETIIDYMLRKHKGKVLKL